MAQIPEPLVEKLCEVYQPKKVTYASMELMDTPGLSRDQQGNAARLSVLREAGCLILVVGAFSGQDFKADFSAFEEDLLIADMDIVNRRVEKLRELVKKPRPTREQDMAELALLEPVLAALEEGQAVRELELSPEQQAAMKSFQLLTQKPKLIIVNTPDDETDFEQYESQGTGILAAPLGLELELSRMEPDEREVFAEEMGLSTASSRDRILRAILDASHQMLFFTAGDKEVRTWLMRRGGTAVDAAGGIHTDLAKGFVRAEVMQIDDILRLRSEREVKAQGLMRKEHKDYVVQEGDILHILSN